MPLFDHAVPTSLLNMQKWFGDVISAPMNDGDTIAKTSPSGNSISEEAEVFILPGPTLKPFQRVELYNQQYWWRLLTILQEAFPALVRLFGYDDFDRLIAVPFLTRYRPDDWSLSTLGRFLPKWIEEHYTADDKPLVYDTCLVDLTFQSLFFKKQHPPLKADDEDLSVKPLYMQPSCALLKFPYDIIAFRKNLLKESVEYWLDHPFPELTKTETFVMFFRTQKRNIKTKMLSSVEWLILNQAQNGVTIDSLCEWIEQQPEDFRLEAEKHLQTWFGEWTIMGLFYIPRE